MHWNKSPQRVAKVEMNSNLFDEKWLKKNGTVFALSVWEDEYKKLSEKLVRLDEVHRALLKRLDDDDWVTEEMDDFIDIGWTMQQEIILAKMDCVEEVIADIKAYDWVEMSPEGLRTLELMPIHVVSRTKGQHDQSGD